MGQKTVLLNEDSHSWGSKLVFLSASIRRDEAAGLAGIAIIRVSGALSPVITEDSSLGLSEAEISFKESAG